MSPLTNITRRPADYREEETMHLFKADTREEMTLCGADTFIHERMTVQYCLQQLIDGNPVGNFCWTCMVCAARWAKRHCEKLEADASLLRDKAMKLHARDATRYRNSIEEAHMEADLLLEQAREYRQLSDTLEGETGRSFHV